MGDEPGANFENANARLSQVTSSSSTSRKLSRILLLRLFKGWCDLRGRGAIKSKRFEACVAVQFAMNWTKLMTGMPW